MQGKRRRVMGRPRDEHGEHSASTKGLLTTGREGRKVGLERADCSSLISHRQDEGDSGSRWSKARPNQQMSLSSAAQEVALRYLFWAHWHGGWAESCKGVVGGGGWGSRAPHSLHQPQAGRVVGI